MTWYTNCVTIIGNGTTTTFARTDTKLDVPIVTLKNEENAKLSKSLNKGFKRSVYWNHYKIFLRNYHENENIRERFDASFQEARKFFVLAYQRGDDNFVNEEAFNKYYLPKIKIKKYNVEIHRRNFYDQAMIQLNNTMKSEKHQQNKVMITQLAIELDEPGHHDRNKQKSLFIF